MQNILVQNVMLILCFITAFCDALIALNAFAYEQDLRDGTIYSLLCVYCVFCMTLFANVGTVLNR